MTRDVRQRNVSISEKNREKIMQRHKSAGPSFLNINLPKLISIVSIVALLVCLVFYYSTNTNKTGFTNTSTSSDHQAEQQFAVIIDAGSTGSRVLAYKFNRVGSDKRLVLTDELFKERKPGLSSFADEPAKGAQSIQMLLNDAKEFVPTGKWTSTPLVLKATAGLRLLPQAKAENLLNSVREVFQKSVFSVESNAVEIMDGTDEGIFSWFTVNFLLESLTNEQQAAALDLGGGSTQVTFAPHSSEVQRVPEYKQHIHEVDTLNRKINLFTNSYLGLGLMAARHAVFTAGYSKDISNVESVCVNPKTVDNKWSYANVEYKVSGAKNNKTTEKPVVDFESCSSLVKKTVLPLVKPKPLTLKQHTVSAFSYYFERAVESGLIDLKGGDITVSAYRKKAEEICSRHDSNDPPFLCFDLTYIYVLLNEGFGLADDKQIKLYKKIDGHEISWALGCAYNELTK